MTTGALILAAVVAGGAAGFMSGYRLNARRWSGWHVESWWLAEKLGDRLWDRACRDGVSCWLDWLPAWTYRHRKEAERSRYLRRQGEPP